MPIEPASDSHATLKEPGPALEQVPGYDLAEVLGRGGMGIVYRARDRQFDRDVAVKLLAEKVPADSPAATRFVVEAKITGQLQHPGIPAVHELGTLPDGRPFLAMKLVKGQTLQILLDGRPSPEHDRGRFLAIFEQVCHAVGYAHAHRVIHRDLKPSNVMVGAFGEVQVMDWGLAKVLGDQSPERERGEEDPWATVAYTTEIDTPKDKGSETRTGSVLGTPAYMAPEQASGEIRKLDPRSDVFGLGAILCQILTGRPPYHGKDAYEVRLLAVRGEMAHALAGLETCGAEPDLVALCKRCLAFKQEDRPADGQAVAEAVAKIRNQAEARARQAEQDRAAALAREAEQRKRRRQLLIAAAIIATVLFAGIVGTTIGLLRAESALDDRTNALAAEQAAKAEAERSEERAKIEAATATAVKDFLRFDLLKLAAASKQYGEEQRGILKTDPDLKVRDLVLRAAEKIEGKFKDQPLVEAEIRWTLGLTLWEIGRADLSIPQFIRMREIYTGMLGPDHPDTLASMNNLALSYADAGRTQEALKLREETLQLMKAKLGPEHSNTLTSMNNLAESYAAVGRRQEALKLREETLRLRKAKFGPDHPETLHSMNAVANSYADAGRTKEALQLDEETLQLRKAKLGPDHPDALWSMNNLAESYAAAGHVQEAFRLREETLQVRRAKLGPDHPDTLLSMNNLADSYIRLGRAADAFTLLAESLKRRQARLATLPTSGVEISGVAWTHGQIGEVEQLRGDYAAAVQAYTQSDAMFGELAKTDKLKAPFFRGRLNVYRRQMELCRKAEQAVADLDFALKQRPAEVPRFLNMRVRGLLKQQKLLIAVETAAKMKERAGTADELYSAACLYALCAAAGKDLSRPTTLPKGAGGAELSDQAIALLKKAVEKGYKNAAHMKQDKDLDPLREREDFRKLLAELEKK